MKTLHIFTIASIAIIASLMASCKIHIKKVSEEIHEKTMQVGEFSSIVLSSPATVHFSIGDSTKILVKAQEGALKGLTIDNDHGCLIISFNPFQHPDNEVPIITGKNQKCDIYITAPSLERVDINGAGSFLCDETIVAEYSQFNILGSGIINLNSIEGNNIDCNLSGSGEFYLGSIRCDSVSLRSSGSGNMKAEMRSAKFTTIGINGSGEITADFIDSEACQADIFGSGSVYINGQLKNLIEGQRMGSGSVFRDGKRAFQ